MKLVPGPLPPIPTGANMDRLPLPIPFSPDFLWRYPLGFPALSQQQPPSSPLLDYKSQLPNSLTSDPRVWSREDVITFLRWAEREFDLQPFDLDNFQMNGKAMCLLTRADLSERAPGSGDVLHNVLQLLVREANNLQRCLPSSPVTPTSRHPYPLSPHSHPPTPNWNILAQNNSDFHTSHAATLAAHLMAQSNSVTLSPAPSVDSQAGSPQHADNQPPYGQTIGFNSNGSNGSGSNQSDSDEDSFPDGKNGSNMSPPNTPTAYAFAPLLPGMPPKSPKEAASSPGVFKREFFPNESPEPNTNGRLLWDFLQQLLNDPSQRYTSYIAWKNRESGVFKIVDPAGLAKLWGIQKNHLSMNYDKMSRALRYYYRVNILRKVQGERHCYQFLRNPTELKSIKIRNQRLKTSMRTILFFTAFINIIPDDLEEGLDGRVITLKIIEDLEGEKVNPLNKFYTEQGCNYSLYYKIFDFSTIKHLAKLIIGDYSVPPKTSVELFGDTVYYLENSLPETKGATGKESKAVKEGDKKKKPIIKKTVKEPASPSTPGTPKGGKKGKKNVIPEVVIVREDKETQYPEPEQEVIEIFVEPKPPPKAGEEDWVYVDVYIPSYVLEIFGTLWENTEDVYMIDLKQLFFVRRITMNVVIPYMNYMKEHMREFIARPDDRQSYMSKFQVMYNEIDADMRDDEEVKAELHCRIVEFREKLWQMCDERMKESENERRRLIQDNWLATQVYELTNNYIVQFQTEMDRFVDTLQLITDYYTACVTKAPAKDVHLQKKPLDKLEIGSYSDIAAEALIWMEAVSELMTNVDSIPENTPFHHCIENNVTTAMAFIDQTLATANSVVGKIGSSMGPTVEGKPAKKKGKEAVPFWEPDPAVKEVAANLLEEWKCVLNGEVQRVKLRIELMRGVALWDVHDMFSCGQKTFHGLYYEIKERYEREVESVRTACDVLSRAVEAETTIQPQMVLDGDKFFIDPEIILFPDPPIIPEPVDLDPPKEDAFTLSQLNALSDMFMDLAPKGYLPERAFLYLIQGIIELNAEDGRPPMLPAIWRKLTPEQSTELFREMFGAAEFVDWRDFILYNLNINFPSEDDMLALRDKFQRRDPDNTELVRDYQLGEVKFWFEKVFWKEDEQELYRIKTTKELLFKLFKTSEDTLNYTALLLAFCKDTNPAAGMAKALALSLGKPVCWDNTIGENFVEAVRYKRVQHELQKLEEQKQHEENLEDATKLVEEIIDYTVHTCDSVVIEDYTSENDVEEPSKDLQTTSSNTLPTSEGSGIISIFTNVSIAFEAVEDTSRIYFLPFEPVLKVVSAALPWHVLVQYSGGETFRRRLEAIYDKCKSAEFHDAVLTHEFLNSPELGEIFQYVSRFTSVKPAHIIKKLIQDDNKT